MDLARRARSRLISVCVTTRYVISRADALFGSNVGSNRAILHVETSKIKLRRLPMIPGANHVFRSRKYVPRKVSVACPYRDIRWRNQAFSSINSAMFGIT